jgi:glycosidase
VTEPWLPLNPDWATRNVAAQTSDPESMLALYRTLLALRRAHHALAIGDIALVDAEDDVLAFRRSHGGENFLIALNLGTAGRALPDGGQGDLLASTLDGGFDGVTLRPNEGVIIHLSGEAP